MSDSSCPFRTDNRKERKQAWEGQTERRPSGGRSAVVIRSVWCYKEGSKEGMANCLLGDEVRQKRPENKALPASYNNSLFLEALEERISREISKNGQKTQIMQKFTYC